MGDDPSETKNPDQSFSMGQGDLPGELPVFPIKGFLLFPKLNLPLNVFEPRYLAMVDDALATPHRLIGMIQPTPGSNDDDDAPALSEVGCASRIASYSETADGRYVIAVRGMARFRIGREISLRNGYRRIVPKWEEFLADLGDGDGDGTLGQEETQDLLSLSANYFGQMQLSIPEKEFAKHSPQDLVNLISVISPFSDNEKQALLEAPDISKRALLVRAFMRDALRNSTHGEPTIH